VVQVVILIAGMDGEEVDGAETVWTFGVRAGATIVIPCSCISVSNQWHALTDDS